MRILTVCSSHRIYGAETITLRLLEEFTRRGHAQLAVTNLWTDGEFSRRLQGLGIAETVMPFGVLALTLSPRAMWWTVNMMVRIPMLWVRWLRTIRRFAPDVIIWTGARQPLPLLPLLGRIPSFVIEYTNVPPTNGNSWLYEHVAAACTGFVAVSGFMRQHLIAVGAPADRTYVVKSGAFFAADADHIPLPAPAPANQPLRIGIVGQVSPHKGHDTLVDAVRQLHERQIPVSVTVFGAGDPDYTDALRATLRAAGLDASWSWKGYERDKAAIYGQMDVCVVPSRFGNPFPTVAMEAGAFAKPVVAARIGGLPEIVEHGVTGLLCAADDGGALADALAWVVTHRDDARRMGEAGRQRVFTEFTVEAMADGFERLFEQCGISRGQ